MNIPETVYVPLRIYVACKLTEEDPDAIKSNADKGLDLAVEVWELGHYPFSPVGGVPTIKCSRHYDKFGTGGSGVHNQEDIDQAYREIVWGYDGDWLRTCDALLLGPGWGRSRGCGYEKFMAEEWGVWLFYDIGEIPQLEQDEEAIALMEELDEQYMRKRRQLLASAEHSSHNFKPNTSLTAHDRWEILMGGK